MKSNDIIFSDLSTYTPQKTIAFYEAVFGWKYYQDNEYYLAYNDTNPVVGLYETPEKFKQMRMPHFWMTYIQVDSAKETIDKVRELGGIVEMEQDIPGFGKVALLRDTLGAGFTIYEGDHLESTRTKNKENTLIWNELHVSDATKIISFYEGVFDWKFRKSNNGAYQIFSDNQHISDMLEIDNTYKGKYEYWVSSFGVRDIQKTQKIIFENGGMLIHKETNRLLMTDNSGEAFFYIKAI